MRAGGAGGHNSGIDRDVALLRYPARSNTSSFYGPSQKY
jgi:hypothetical protein